MRENEARPSLGGGIMLLIGAVLIVIAVAFLTYGIYGWMRLGGWPDYPASKMLSEIGIPHPRLSWEAAQRAIDWLLSISSCIFLFAIGIPIAFLGGWMMARHDRRQKPA